MKMSKLTQLVRDLLYLQSSKGECLAIEDVIKYLPESQRETRTMLKRVDSVLRSIEKAGIAENIGTGYILTDRKK